MSPLVVEVDGRVLRLEGNSVIRIGRAIDAEVVLTAGSVSRQHAELRPVDGSWVLVDAGSQFGTYVNGVRVVEHTIRDRTVVRCGPIATGSELTITPASMVSAERAGGRARPGPASPPRRRRRRPRRPSRSTSRRCRPERVRDPSRSPASPPPPPGPPGPPGPCGDPGLPPVGTQPPP